MQRGIDLNQIAVAIFEPARTFGELIFIYPWEVTGLGALGVVLMSLMMFGSVLGLIRSPGAFIATLVALVGFSLFFTLVYPGSYRHQALWLVFLLSMYWIACEGRLAPEQFRARPKPIVWLSVVGSSLTVLLVAVQLRGGVRAVVDVALDGLPQSRSRDFSYFIKDRPDLKDAVIIADPDYLLEALPYYIGNPTYLIRERRFANIVTFTSKAQLSLDLDDILNVAGKLNQERRLPIVILLAKKLDSDQPAIIYPEGYNWKLLVTPEQVHRFLAATQLLARFGPAKSDESFDAYLFDRP
jgi:hypothetical protein